MSWGRSSVSNSSSWFLPVFFSVTVHGVIVLGGNFVQILDVRPRAPRIFTVEIILNPLKEGKQIKSSLDKKISSTVQKSSFPSKAQTSVTNTVIPPAEKSNAAVPPKERLVKKLKVISVLMM